MIRIFAAPAVVSELLLYVVIELVVAGAGHPPRVVDGDPGLSAVDVRQV